MRIPAGIAGSNSNGLGHHPNNDNKSRHTNVDVFQVGPVETGMHGTWHYMQGGWTVYSMCIFRPSFNSYNAIPLGALGMFQHIIAYNLICILEFQDRGIH